MARRFIKTGSFTGVAAGQTATLDLPVGSLKYHMLQLEYASGAAGGPTQAQMEADLTEFRLRVNGKVQRRFSAADLFVINQWNGLAVSAGGAATNGILPLWFSEPWRRAAQGEDALAWATGDVQTLQLEVDIAAGANAPAFVDPTAEIERVSEPMGGIVKWRKFTIPVTAIGLVQFFPPRVDAYARMHLREVAAADITAVKVVLEGEEIFDASDFKIEPIYTSYGLVPQTAVFHVAFDRTNRVSDFLPTIKRVGANGSPQPVSEFKLELTMAAANSPTLITEVFGPRD